MIVNFNLASTIYQHSVATPTAVAVQSKRQSVTYAEIAERAMRVAEYLKHSRYWTRPDGQPPRVGILASRGIDACVALIGACWAGATYIPINLKLPEDRILTLLGLCDLSAMITDEEGTKLLSRSVLKACPPLVIHAECLSQIPEDCSTELVDIVTLPAVTSSVPVQMGSQDIAYIIFTSGTTGVPKGVMISAGSARHYIEMITQRLGLLASDRVLETCELSFDFSVHNMFSTWQAGASLHILPAALVMNAVKFARNAQLTVWNSVPSLVGMLRQIKALKPDSLPNLRLTVFGGEQLPEASVVAWQAAAPDSTIHNLYGPTEATVFCLAQTITTPIPLTPNRDVVAIGSPLPGNHAMVIDENGAEVADGTSGELAISGVQIAEGYLNAPALTELRFPVLHGKRWYRSGDLAMRDSAGTFHCLGRIDNQVKVLGYRIELEEVDAHLRIVANVDLVGAVAWPLVDGMARGVVGFVGVADIDTDKIIADLKARLPAYMVPNQIFALDRMPLNQSGKVDRRALHQFLDKTLL